MRAVVTIILLSFLTITVSCDQRAVYDEYVRIDGGWRWQDAREFSVEINDTLSMHNIYVQVRHTVEYPMSNLYLFVHVKGPTGQHRKDTVNMILAAPSGEWTGRGSGNLREVQLLFRKQTQFRINRCTRFKCSQSINFTMTNRLNIGFWTDMHSYLNCGCFNSRREQRMEWGV